MVKGKEPAASEDEGKTIQGERNNRAEKQGKRNEKVDCGVDGEIDL